MRFFPRFAAGLLGLGFAAAPALAQQAPAPTSANALVATGQSQPQLVSRQFEFTEGPAVDKAGNVFFTDQPNDAIWRYGTDGKLSVFKKPAGRSNGLYFDKKGNLLACADEQSQLWSIAPDGKVTVLLHDLAGRRLNGPNDLWVSPTNGAIYFTDPYYQRDYWTRTASELDGQKVYYMASTQAAPVVVDGQLRQPNGIIGTPDGRTLYVADIGANKTYRYRIGRDGQLQDRQLFVEQGSDGMTIDNQGNVYLTGKGVDVFNPAGQRIAHFDIPEAWTANVCFGGKDRRTLFITASKGIYTLPMRVRGVW